jgi:FkbM family methyltransferase
METLHFLLTRFNVPIASVPVDFGLNDDWLEHRFALFENFCLPSVLAQQNKDFRWLLWMDERTPERWQSKLRADLQPLPSAQVLMVKPGTDMFWQADLEKLSGAASDKRVLTTRLDNDDAISRDYLAAIRQCADELPHQDRYYVINYQNGCQASHLGLFAVAERLNPFLSVASPARPLKTAWHTSHTAMNQIGKVLDHGKFSRTPLYWLQSVHGNNVANRLQRRRVRIDDRQLERFSLGANWMRLLQGEKFVMPKQEADWVHFAYPRQFLAEGDSSNRACEIAISGLRGEYLFEQIRSEKTFYKNELLQFLGFLTKGMDSGLMIDVGANIGNHTLYFARILGAEVIAIEPNPVALNLLKSNVARNDLGDRVTVVEAAAWDTAGPAQWRAGSQLNLGATIIVPAEKPGPDCVEMLPLDEIVTRRGRKNRISLVKVAVEGAENRSLRGAMRVLQTWRPILVIEASTEDALKEIEKTLSAFHYAKAGPFCEGTYVFAPERWPLLRAQILQRMSRTTARLKRKLFREGNTN